MKKLLMWGMVVVFFAACTKTDINPGTRIISASSQDLASVKKRSAFLLSHQWVYNGFYFHYVNQKHKGNPQYVRGASNNILNLDNTEFTFSNNGTFVEVDGGYTYPGKWWFSDSTASLLVMDYQYWTDRDSIRILNDLQFNYTQPLGYHDKTYTELIPPQ